MTMKTKRCTKCGEVKPYEMFDRDKRRKDAYTSRCKVCKSKINKAYYETNKESIRDSHKSYYQSNKEKIKDSKKAYQKNNKGKIRDRKKAYYESNKEKYIEAALRREAIKRRAIPKFLIECEAERKRLRDIYKLSRVISLATGIEHHVDHMWPLSDGGPHWSGNLQIITAKENFTKSYKVCKVTKKNIKESLRIARKEYENSSNGHRNRKPRP